MDGINDVDSGSSSNSNDYESYSPSVSGSVRLDSMCSSLVNWTTLAHAIFLIDVCLMLFTQKTIYEIDNPSKFQTVRSHTARTTHILATNNIELSTWPPSMAIQCCWPEEDSFDFCLFVAIFSCGNPNLCTALYISQLKFLCARTIWRSSGERWMKLKETQKKIMIDNNR